MSHPGVHRPRLGALLLAAATLGVVAPRLDAQTYVVKADNTTALGTGTSWTGGVVPGATTIADWTGTYNTANSLSAALPGSGLSWAGIRVGVIGGTAAGLVSIGGTGNATASSALTVGSSGIDMSAANQNVVVNAATINLNVSQTFNIATGRNLRFGISGTGAGNANVDGNSATAVITIAGGGVFDANQAGGTSFSDVAGYAGFQGKWAVESGATLRGIRNGASAWGTNTSADAILLKGGTLAVGGISGSQGDWTWTTNIRLGAGTSSTIDNQIFSGTDRFLKLNGSLSSEDAAAILTFRETSDFSNAAKGFILTGSNSGLAGTVRIGTGSGNGVNVRVGGITGNDATLSAGTTGDFGSAIVEIATGSILNVTRSNAYAFSNLIQGGGHVYFGNGQSTASTQVVTLGASNTFTGNVFIYNGVVVASTVADGGVASSIGAGTGAQSILGGTLRYVGTGHSTNRNLQVNNSTTSTIEASGTGALRFTGTGTIGYNGQLSARTLNLGGTNTDDNYISIVIGDNGGATTIRKTGAGTWVLAGNNSFTGGVQLTDGTVRVGSNSGLGTGTVAMASGTRLTAEGAVARSFTNALSLGAVANFGSTGNLGALTTTGGVTLTANAELVTAADLSTGAVSGAFTLAKSGAGTLTLSGASTYTGSTTVTSGKLKLATGATLASTAYAFSDGTALETADGFGLSAGRTMSVGAGVSVGRLDVTGALNLTGGSLAVDFNGGTSHDLVAVVGGVDLTSGTLAFNNLAGAYVAGTYDFLTYTGVATGLVSNLTLTGLVNDGTSRQTFGVSDTGTALRLTVGGSAANVRWTGANGGAWDSGASGTANWLVTDATFTGDGARFYSADSATFDDSAATGAVTIAADVTAANLIFANETLAYTFTGAGDILGPAIITKGGAAKVTLAVAYAGTGGVTVNAGELEVATGGSLGSGLVTVNGGVLTLTDNAAAGTSSVTLSGGTLRLGAVTHSRGFAIDADGGSVESFGGTAVVAGAVTGSGNLAVTAGTVQFAGLLGAAGSFSGGLAVSSGAEVDFASASSQTLAGAVTGAGTLAKSGSGTLVLTAASSAFAGTLAPSAGTLSIGASTPALGSATLNPGGNVTLASVTGAARELASAVTLASGRILSLNASAADLTLSGAISGDGAMAKSTSGTAILTGASNFAGGFTLSSGTLRVGSSQALGVGTLSITGASTLGALAGSGNHTLANALSLGANLGVDAAGTTLTLSGALSGTANLTGTGTSGTLRLTGAGSTTGNLILNAASTIEVAAGADLTFAQVQMGATNGLNLLKVSGGTLGAAYYNIGNANSQSGKIEITGGTLRVVSGNIGFRLGHWNHNGNAVSTFTQTGGVFDATDLANNAASGDRLVAIGWDGQGNATVGGGAGQALFKAYGLVVDGNGDSASYVSSLTLLANGRLELGAGGTGGADFLVLDGGVAAATATATWAAKLTASSTGTVAVDTGLTVTQSGVVDGAGTLSKSGAGTLVLSGANTLTGVVEATAGTLTLSGTHRSVSQIRAAGATVNLNATNLLVSGHGIAVDASRSLFADGGTLSFGNVEMRVGNITLRNGSTLVSNRVLSGYDILLADNSSGASTLRVENTGGSTAASSLSGPGGLRLFGTQVFSVDDVTGDSSADLVVDLVLGTPGTTSPAGTGGFRKQGSGTMVLNNAANTLNGSVIVEQGVLRAGAAGVLGTSSVSLDGGTLDLGGFAFANTLTLGGGAIIGGSGLTGSVLLNSGTFTLSSANQLGTSTVSVGTGATLDLSSFNATLSAVLSTGGAILGADNWTGNVRINSAVTSTELSTLGGAIVTLGTGGSADLDGVSRTIILDGGSVTAYGNFSGHLAVASGTLDLSAFVPAAPATLEVRAGATLAFGANPYARTVTYRGGSVTGAFSGNLNVIGTGVSLVSGNLAQGDVLVGAGNSVAIGAGLANDIILQGGSISSGRSTFSGVLTVSNGSVVNLGTNPAAIEAATYILGNGGLITGQATVAGLTVGSGGVLAVGNSPGVINVANNLVLVGGGRQQLELMSEDGLGGSPQPGVHHDVIVVAGQVNLSGLSSSSRFQLELISLTDPQTQGALSLWDPNATLSWEIIQFGPGNLILGGNAGLGTNLSSLFSFDTDAMLDTGGIAINSAGFSVNVVGNSIVLTYSAIPEPSTYGLVLGGLALAGAAFRRRRKASASVSAA